MHRHVRASAKLTVRGLRQQLRELDGWYADYARQPLVVRLNPVGPPSLGRPPVWMTPLLSVLATGLMLVAVIASRPVPDIVLSAVLAGWLLFRAALRLRHRRLPVDPPIQPMVVTVLQLTLIAVVVAVAVTMAVVAGGSSSPGPPTITRIQ